MARVTLGVDTSGRPLVVDDRTLAKLRLAESRIGFKFTIVQGSWRAGSGAAASADTHDKGGVIDIRTWNIPPSIGTDKAVLELRKAGLIAWHRTTAQGFDDHIHAVDYGNPWLSPGAARQVTAWENGRNGLASNGLDDGPRVNIPKDPPEEDDMAMSDKERAAFIKDIAEAAANEVRKELLGGQQDAPKGRYLGATLTGIYNGVQEIKRLLTEKEK